MIQRRPNGRYAVTVYEASLKRRRQVGTFDKLKDARKAESAAKTAVRSADRETVASFAARWTTDFPRPKASTNQHNAERVAEFARLHARTAMTDIAAKAVDQYLSGQPLRRNRVPALRAMFNDARRRGIVTQNPFANLGLPTPRGNRDRPPPSQEQIAVMLEHAWNLTPPSFAGWLQVATSTGMRPGELDAIQWNAVNLEQGEAVVKVQWSAATRELTLPKNGRTRVIAITPPALDALLRLPRESEWVFTTLRGTHYTPSSRSFHWNRVRAAAGLHDFSLYRATRHYAASYLYNVLDLPAEDVAIQLGHRDGGQLVREVYGHRDEARARDRIKRAWAAEIRPLRAVDERGIG